MRPILGRLHVGVLALLLAAGSAQAASLEDKAALETFVDGLATSLMRRHNSPSGAVAIVHRGELIFSKGYGYQDVEERIPVDPATTLFRPGSVSKLSTWVAVMQLVEQGKLDLDTDVNEYLETFRIKDTFDEPITLRHIMTHTAGFEDGAVGYLIIDDPEKAYPLRESMPRYQPERVNPPGKQTAYSNYATALAGLIVENVSGLPFNDYVRERIFEPLRMTNSSFEEPLPEPLAANMATSYTLENGRFVEQPFEIIKSFGPAGAQSATVTDMVRFGQAILNGGELDGTRILREDTVAQMLSRTFTHDDRLTGMALGFYQREINDNLLVGHGGDTMYFHSYLGIDRANELTFFVSFSGSGGSDVRSVFTPSFYDEYFPVTKPRPEPPSDFADRAGSYAGSYGFWRSNFSTLEKALGLAGGVQVAPTEDDTLLVAFGGGAKQYVEVDDNLFRELNPAVSMVSGISPALIAFQENENGEITGFVMDGLPFMSLRRLPLVATPNFNFTLIGLSVLVFIGVVMGRWYRRKLVREMPAADRSATNAAFYAALANILVLVSGAIVLSIVGDSLFSGIPLTFKLWLVTPVIAVLATLYLVYRNVLAWQHGSLGGMWTRIRLTVVTLCALFMTWFYYYWNLLGWQYMT
ncbi:MAG: serine hydrolase domain-containing protein [Woeseiaceae bacterium]|jgi:CubicO group peptidase (beta-lactamase class C family)|nr:serine hydrolase domain-containing protein [Woeseiaceae bacterium]